MPIRRSLALLLLLVPSTAFAWGQNGHRVTGLIAENHLTETARQAVADLLEGHSLARASTWADEIRSEPRWACASPFHYVTIPPNGRYPDAGVREGDAMQALIYLVDQMADPAAPRQLRADALRFVTHLVGDLHQPLHVGRGCDRGGNDLQVLFFDEEANLHSVWDTQLVEDYGLSFTEMAAFLDLALPEEIRSMQQDSPRVWLEEAAEKLKTVYRCSSDRRGDRCPCFCGDCEDGWSVFGGCESRQCELKAAGMVRLRYTYRHRARPLVEDGLLRGGIRLAGLLNWIFDPQVQPPAGYQSFAAEIRALPDWDTASKACPTEP